MKLSRLFVLATFLLVMTCGIGHAGYVNTSGYTSQDTVFSIPYAWSVYGFDILPNGNFAAFIDNSIVEITPDGTVSAPLYSFQNSVFGSFLKINNGSIYFGESSNGTIWSMGLDGSNATQLGTIGNPYDIAFNSLGQSFISGNPDWAGQKLIYFNGTSDDIVTDLAGFSGPLAFDANGNLVYTTAYSEEGDSVLRFNASDLARAIGDGSLTQADGQVLAGVAPPSDMEIDSEGNIYITSGGSIYRVSGEQITPWASSLYTLTTLAYDKKSGTIYTLANSVTVDGKQVGVISAINPVPEPGSLVALAGMLSLTGMRFIKRRKNS